MSNLRKILGVNRKTFLNPTAWLGYDSLKDQNVTLYTILRNLFVIPQPFREETFEQAMVRLNLTEEDVQKSLKQYHTNALILALSALVIFLYAFYLLFRYFTILGWLLGLAASGILLSQAFKYDFWALQIKKRKLGLTLDDWKKHLFGSE